MIIEKTIRVKGPKDRLNNTALISEKECSIKVLVQFILQLREQLYIW